MGKGMENSFSNILPFSCPGQEAQYQKSANPDPFPTLFPSGLYSHDALHIAVALSDALFFAGIIVSDSASLLRDAHPALLCLPGRDAFCFRHHSLSVSLTEFLA